MGRAGRGRPDTRFSSKSRLLIREYSSRTTRRFQAIQGMMASPLRPAMDPGCSRGSGLGLCGQRPPIARRGRPPPGHLIGAWGSTAPLSVGPGLPEAREDGGRSRGAQGISELGRGVAPRAAERRGRPPAEETVTGGPVDVSQDYGGLTVPPPRGRVEPGTGAP